jgi:hypothetical protein
MLESNRCNHRVDATDRLLGPFKVSEDSAGKFGTRPIEKHDFRG